MRIDTHTHRHGQEIFARLGKPARVFADLLVNTMQSKEDIFTVARRWHDFLRKHGWKPLKSPLRTSVMVEDQFLLRQHACLSLSLVHGNQVGHVLLAMQGLFIQKEITVGIVCVEGNETFDRVKDDLSWLHKVLTVPIFLVAVQ